jgi:hypothetical protein
VSYDVQVADPVLLTHILDAQAHNLRESSAGVEGHPRSPERSRRVPSACGESLNTEQDAKVSAGERKVRLFRLPDARDLHARRHVLVNVPRRNGPGEDGSERCEPRLD